MQGNNPSRFNFSDKNDKTVQATTAEQHEGVLCVKTAIITSCKGTDGYFL